MVLVCVCAEVILLFSCRGTTLSLFPETFPLSVRMVGQEKEGCVSNSRGLVESDYSLSLLEGKAAIAAFSDS